MLLETYRGRDLSRVLARVRATLGPDAILVRTRRIRKGSGEIVEVVATTGEELEVFRKRLERSRRYRQVACGAGRASSRSSARQAPGRPRRSRSGAAPCGVRRQSCRLITLDTYRVAALEQLATYAEIMDIPLEVVYGVAETACARAARRQG